MSPERIEKTVRYRVLKALRASKRPTTAAKLAEHESLKDIPSLRRMIGSHLTAAMRDGFAERAGKKGTRWQPTSWKITDLGRQAVRKPEVFRAPGQRDLMEAIRVYEETHPLHIERQRMMGIPEAVIHERFSWHTTPNALPGDD